jgi:hypothetical protein
MSFLSHHAKLIYVKDSLPAIIEKYIPMSLKQDEYIQAHQAATWQPSATLLH